MNSNPFTKGDGFHPDAVYRFNIDTDGDALADVAFSFTFSPYDNGRQTATAYYATGSDACFDPSRPPGCCPASRCRAHPRPGAGYRLGSDRGSPNQGRVVLSKRVRALIWPLVRVRTYRPVPWRMLVGVRR
jgi:hypothetical protein